MATTTNYSWTTPDDTALVKDGAAAIRTLGSSIDTTTKNLNPSTTLGDIEYRSSTANTNTRLPIGTTGQILTVAGGVPSWGAAPSSGGMTLLSNTTLSGTSVTVSSISADYTDLILFFAGLSMSGGGGQTKIQAYFNSNASIINTSGTYRQATTSAVSGTTDSFIQFNYGDLKGNNANNAFVIRVNNYANTSYYKTLQANFGGTESGDLESSSNFGGVIKTNSAISTFNLINSDGRTFSGNLKIYGVK
jgi:hypothetical protein